LPTPARYPVVVVGSAFEADGYRIAVASDGVVRWAWYGQVVPSVRPRPAGKGSRGPLV